MKLLCLISIVCTLQCTKAWGDLALWPRNELFGTTPPAPTSTTPAPTTTTLTPTTTPPVPTSTTPAPTTTTTSATTTTETPPDCPCDHPWKCDECPNYFYNWLIQTCEQVKTGCATFTRVECISLCKPPPTSFICYISGPTPCRKVYYDDKKEKCRNCRIKKQCAVPPNAFESKDECRECAHKKKKMDKKKKKEAEKTLQKLKCDALQQEIDEKKESLIAKEEKLEQLHTEETKVEQWLIDLQKLIAEIKATMAELLNDQTNNDPKPEVEILISLARDFRKKIEALEKYLDLIRVEMTLLRGKVAELEGQLTDLEKELKKCKKKLKKLCKKVE